MRLMDILQGMDLSKLLPGGAASASSQPTQSPPSQQPQEDPNNFGGMYPNIDQDKAKKVIGIFK